MTMAMSMYGIPNTVSDACGTFGPTFDEELCARWMQTSAFLPLIRNYWTTTYFNTTLNTWMPNTPSELFNMKNFTYQFAASSALSQRMSYLRYIYSQMYSVYRDGGALVKPLFFDYPTDDNCFTKIEDTFMLGDSIKVSPVLDAGVTGSY
jgi:alpha-glucosidase (family GH31 glycosyl hydrolase)